MSRVRLRMGPTPAEVAAIAAEFPDADAAPAEAVVMVLDRIDVEGVDGWARRIGLSAEAVSRWRARLLG